MSWPLPVPADIADRGASVFETAQNPDGSLAFPGIDARSPNTVATTIARLVAMAMFDAYLYQQYCSVELFPDTAVDELDHHLSIWGIVRTPPIAAQATITLSAAAALTLPTGLLLTAPSNAQYATTSGGPIAAGASLVVGVTAVVPGSAGTLSAGTTLSLVNPVAGLSPQSGLVIGDGTLLPGEDLESDASAKARMLEAIRNPGAGGDADDYAKWARAANSGVQYVSVIGGYAGLGTVGVFVAMAGTAGAGPRAPTSAELAQIAAYITDPSRKPVTAQVIVLAATLQPVPVTIHLTPDTVAIRAAATAALSLFFATDSQITAPGQSGTGAAVYSTVDVSRLDNALSTADGETSHDRTLPAADVTGGAGVLLTLGPVSFV